MEDLLKQGASHPIHQRAFHERVAQLQAELQRKDATIMHLNDQISQQSKIDPNAYLSGQSSAQTGAGQSSSGNAPTA